MQGDIDAGMWAGSAAYLNVKEEVHDGHQVEGHAEGLAGLRR
jgi:hypothetical protein